MIKKIICLLLCLSVFCFVSPINFAKASTHTHDDNCYAGEVHIHEGVNTKKAGCYQGAYIRGKSYTCGEYEKVDPPTMSVSSTGNRWCYNCSSNPRPAIDFIQYRCSSCWESKTVTIREYCGYCGYAFYEDTSHYGATYGTHEKTTPGTYALSCGMEEGKYYINSGHTHDSTCFAENECVWCDGDGMIEFEAVHDLKRTNSGTTICGDCSREITFNSYECQTKGCDGYVWSESCSCGYEYLESSPNAETYQEATALLSGDNFCFEICNHCKGTGIVKGTVLRCKNECETHPYHIPDSGISINYASIYNKSSGTWKDEGSLRLYQFITEKVERALSSECYGPIDTLIFVDVITEEGKLCPLCKNSAGVSNYEFETYRYRCPGIATETQYSSWNDADTQGSYQAFSATSCNGSGAPYGQNNGHYMTISYISPSSSKQCSNCKSNAWYNEETHSENLDKLTQRYTGTEKWSGYDEYGSYYEIIAPRCNNYTQYSDPTTGLSVSYACQQKTLVCNKVPGLQYYGDTICTECDQGYILLTCPYENDGELCEPICNQVVVFLLPAGVVQSQKESLYATKLS